MGQGYMKPLRVREIGAYSQKCIMTTSTALPAGLNDDRAGISFKSLGVLVVGALGLFGTGFMSTLQGIGKDVAFEQKAAALGVSNKVKSSEASRGSKTRLSRKEINGKLAQIPLFYISNGLGGVFTEEGSGKFFETKTDAETYAKSLGGNRKIEAATMDEIYFSLMKKKAKLSVSGRIAANSDPEAVYSLVATPAEVERAGKDFIEKHPSGDIPLYRVPTMAFERENGLELPLFTERGSAKAAYTKLQADRGTRKESPSSSRERDGEEFQVTSVLDVIELWRTGGAESRALEVYPSMAEIDNYKSMRKMNE